MRILTGISADSAGSFHPARVRLGMHNEIFHFEILKKNHGNLKYFNTRSLKCFMKFLIFIIK